MRNLSVAIASLAALAFIAMASGDLRDPRELEHEGPESPAELMAAHDVYFARAGRIPEGVLRKAVEHKRAMESLKTKVAGAAGDWAEYGIGPLNCAPSFCSARVDNFAYDPEAKRLFAAVGTG